MKGQFSRISHQESKRYSGVYQQQGRMLTDADWNELVETVKRQQQAVFADVVGEGAPRDGGILTAPTADDPDLFKWGIVYAGGVRAELSGRPPTDGEASGPNGLKLPPPVSPAALELRYLFENQADLRNPPRWPTLAIGGKTASVIPDVSALGSSLARSLAGAAAYEGLNQILLTLNQAKAALVARRKGPPLDPVRHGYLAESLARFDQALAAAKNDANAPKLVKLEKARAEVGAALAALKPPTDEATGTRPNPLAGLLQRVAEWSGELDRARSDVRTQGILLEIGSELALRTKSVSPLAYRLGQADYLRARSALDGLASRVRVLEGERAVSEVAAEAGTQLAAVFPLLEKHRPSEVAGDAMGAKALGEVLEALKTSKKQLAAARSTTAKKAALERASAEIGALATSIAQLPGDEPLPVKEQRQAKALAVELGKVATGLSKNRLLAGQSRALGGALEGLAAVLAAARPVAVASRPPVAAVAPAPAPRLASTAPGLGASFVIPPILTKRYHVYVDVWERLVVALQDRGLQDPALHGADTCVRTQVLAQLKIAEASQLEFQVPPSQGTGEVSVSAPVPGQVEGNALFRVEVHHVKWQAGKACEVTFKWSTENGAEAYPTRLEQPGQPAFFPPDDFWSDGHIYELFSDDTERCLGAQTYFGPDGKWEPARGKLETGNKAKQAVRTTKDWPYIRRWDGCVTVRAVGSAWQVVSAAGVLQGGALTASKLELAPGGAAFLRLSITLGTVGDPRIFLPGDFWLALLRGGTDEPVRQLSILPCGVRHHYLPVAKLNASGAVLPRSSAETFRLSFPNSTVVTARDIPYEPAVAGAETVGDVLDGVRGWKLVKEGSSTCIQSDDTVRLPGTTSSKVVVTTPIELQGVTAESVAAPLVHADDLVATTSVSAPVVRDAGNSDRIVLNPGGNLVLGKADGSATVIGQNSMSLRTGGEDRLSVANDGVVSIGKLERDALAYEDSFVVVGEWNSWLPLGSFQAVLRRRYHSKAVLLFCNLRLGGNLTAPGCPSSDDGFLHPILPATASVQLLVGGKLVHGSGTIEYRRGDPTRFSFDYAVNGSLIALPSNPTDEIGLWLELTAASSFPHPPSTDPPTRWEPRLELDPVQVWMLEA